MINDSQYRKSGRCFPTGVSILATQDDNENYLGMTANSVMSISLNPKIIMVSVGNNRSILKFLQETKNASVSILSSEQSNVADFFSTSTQNLLENNDFFYNSKDIYYIKDSLCYFYCEVMNSYLVGDHTVFSLKVDQMNLNEKSSPLIWYKGKFSNKNL